MKIAILGYGTEGKALAQYFKRRGAELTVCDQSPKVKVREKAKVKLGKNAFKGLKGFDMVFKSPGIPPKQVAGVKNLTTLTRYFFEHCPCPIIGVTGTKGKGTTSTLIYEILKAAGYDVYLGGNIGVPPLEFLDKLKKKSWVILELSSFQTQDLDRSPHIAVVLKTTSEHMDYHKNLREYHRAKTQLLRYQKKKDIVVTNIDYPTCIKIARKSKGQHFNVSTRKRVAQGAHIKPRTKQGKIILKNGKKTVTIMPIKEVGLIGAHNLENILPSVVVAGLLDVSPSTIRKAVAAFKGLPHRLEHVATVDKVAYYNDSFSTTPETSIAAVKAFDAPIHLIAGGSEKLSDFTEWAKICMSTKNLKTILLTGNRSATRMAKALASTAAKTLSQSLASTKNYKLKTTDSPLILRVKNLKDAMARAKVLAQPRDIVLLSPACASFEEFPNYKVRGEVFGRLAKEFFK